MMDEISVVMCGAEPVAVFVQNSEAHAYANKLRESQKSESKAIISGARVVQMIKEKSKNDAWFTVTNGD